MSTICGFFSFDAPPPSAGEIGMMNEATVNLPRDMSGTWREAMVALGSSLLRTTPESAFEEFPLADQEAGLILVADARIDNRDELLAQLNPPRTFERSATDGELILYAYKKWGEACPEHLIGDFAFAIWDVREKKLFCARDHIGARPFCYYRRDGRFLFASVVAGIVALPCVTKRIDEIFLADFLCVIDIDKERTAYAEISRLLPGHSLIIKSDGSMKLHRYWQLDPHREIHFATEEEYFEGFREKLTEAVRCRVRSNSPVASELTGGQDSSMIVAFAHRILRGEGRTLKTFTNALPGVKKKTVEEMLRSPSDCDEHPLVDMIVDYCGLAEHAYITPSRNEGEPILLEAMSRRLAMNGNLNFFYGMQAEPLYRNVREGRAKVLLSGLGGDQLVTSQGNGYHAELVRNRDWRTIWREANGLSRIHGHSMFRNLVGTIFQGYPGLRGRLQEMFRREQIAGERFALETTPISADFAHRMGVSERRLRALAYFGSTSDPCGSFRERQVMDAEWTYLPSSMEDRSFGSLMHGVETRYPLLDKRLMEYVLAVPGEFKVRDGWGRYLARRGTEGLLPPEVQWRKTKIGPNSIPYAIDTFRKNIGELGHVALAMNKNPALALYVDYGRLVAFSSRFEQGVGKIPYLRGALLRGILAGRFLEALNLH